MMIQDIGLPATNGDKQRGDIMSQTTIKKVLSLSTMGKPIYSTLECLRTHKLIIHC
jgi:hypothetical protein